MPRDSSLRDSSEPKRPAQAGAAKSGTPTPGTAASSPSQSSPANAGPAQSSPAQSSPAKPGPSQAAATKSSTWHSGPATSGPAKSAPSRPGDNRADPANAGHSGKNRRVPVSLPAMESAAGGWLRGMRFSGFSLLMLVIIVLFVVVLAPSLRTLIQQQEQIGALQKSVSNQKSDVDALRDDVARWNDPAYIEAQARDRLLYVYPGEYSYLVMNGQTSTTAPVTPSGTKITKDIQNPDVDWVGAMTSSVLNAGLTNEPATKLVAPDITGAK